MRDPGVLEAVELGGRARVLHEDESVVHSRLVQQRRRLVHELLLQVALAAHVVQLQPVEGQLACTGREGV